MSSFYGNQAYNSPYMGGGGIPPYVEAPAPPGPIPGEYSQQFEEIYAEPGSPLVYPVSPTVGMSPAHSRDNSRTRYDEPMIRVPGGGRDKSYHASHLSIGASSKALSRSNSGRSGSRPPVYVEVAKTATRGRHGREGSVGTHYYYDEAGRKRAPSTYSNSSYGSRGHSRSHSKVRHSRTSSRGSYDSYDEEYDEHETNHAGAVGLYRGGRREEEDLSLQLRKVQQQLEQVHLEADKKKKEEEIAILEKRRTEEIEKKVAEQLAFQRKKEADEAAALKKQQDDERAKIKAEAEKIIAERLAQEKAIKDKEEAEKKRIDALVGARYAALNQGRKTYTKFSKIHLCKEALDERKIAYTEEAEHFLVHRVVDKTEQNYLWSRTKEIRNYYRQIQDAADKAPTVRGPNGGWVKYVQIAGQPYPMALPVTITQTPGGGQTQIVDKIKWTDIFRQF